MDWTKVKFIRGLFLDDDGAPSFSRVATGILALFTCVVITYLVRKNGTWPDGAVWAGMAAFVSALYASNRLGR